MGREVGAVVAGAAFTTFDEEQGGCLHGNGNGINCNLYASKEDVYINGGPVAGGLSDGTYYFTVLTPGAQNGGFLQGAVGNLSDNVAHGGNDQGIGDTIEDRTFVVDDHEIVDNLGSHAEGESPSGRLVLQLFPYDDTSNNGGVYILAICQLGATSPSQCKYDAFKVEEQEQPPPKPPCCGDGHVDDGEQCDDGNTTDGDGCSSDCKNEDTPPACCGDGRVDPGEQCDDGNTTDGDGCSSDCQNEDTPPACCGDERLDAGEQCDDGNTIDGDGCSSSCTLEPGSADPVPIDLPG